MSKMSESLCLKFRKGDGSRGRAKLDAKCVDCGALCSSHYPRDKARKMSPERAKIRAEQQAAAKAALKALIVEKKLEEKHKFYAGRRGRPGHDMPCVVCGVTWDKHPALAPTPKEHVGKLVRDFMASAEPVKPVKAPKPPKAPKAEKPPKPPKAPKAPKAEKPAKAGKQPKVEPTAEEPKQPEAAPAVVAVEEAVAEAFGLEFDPNISHGDNLVRAAEALAAKCGDNSTSSDW